MKRIIPIFIVLMLFGSSALANGLPDRDRDGVPDRDEIEVYHTNPDNPDTDGDGYGDWQELNTGYSPYNKERVKLALSDADKDGLNDDMELRFRTDPTKSDTDGDGYPDGQEVDNGYDPKQSGRIALAKRIEINLKDQKLRYFLGGVALGEFVVSTGKASMPTPKGSFIIINKSPKAWSFAYGLWMPYWMGLGNGSFGIHELPVWPGGYREGENHLGTPVSHGCIRLGVGAAKTLYDWAPVGTNVVIK